MIGLSFVVLIAMLLQIGLLVRVRQSFPREVAETTRFVDLGAIAKGNLLVVEGILLARRSPAMNRMQKGGMKGWPRREAPVW